MIVTVDELTIEGAEAYRSYLEALENGSVEVVTTELFRRSLKPGMIVADIGAFLGQYSLLAARQVGVSGKVFAFEPDRRNFAFLAKNIERNAMADRITAVPHAISDHNGEIALFLDPAVGSGSSLVFRRRRSVSRETVQTVTLDRFLGADVTPDVIKMDVEGGEVRALNGMQQLMRRAGPGLVMFVECFPKALRAGGAGVHLLVERLEQYGFHSYVIDEKRRRLFPINSTRSSIWGFHLFLGLRSLLVANFLCVRTNDHPLLTAGSIAL